MLNREASGSRWRIRPDGAAKVTGRLEYLTDKVTANMLYGRVLRSEYPHARILSIDTKRAAALPGVQAVLTHVDIPGLNRFGIAHPNQPVFCEERVRYVGDAVAAVAADSDELAEYALTMIDVRYEPLPVLDTPEAAMAAQESQETRLHPEGNILHSTSYSKGNIEEAFRQCAHVVEETYCTPRQMHTYMETEGGLFVPERDGRLVVYSATQHGRMDRLQLARILALPQSQIRVVSSPIGGSFGGKDELNVQPYGSLLSLRTGKPVKMHNSRKESVRAGLKRHPMKIAMRTGTDAEGRLIAHKVHIISDTGAYATLGAEVLNFAVEHATGAYRFPNVEVSGCCVYTNNGVSGEFRGFGGSQAIFALEGQMDRLAARLNMDPWAFRSLNLREASDEGPLGQRIAQTNGARQVWEAIEGSQLWAERREPANPSLLPSLPWIRTGIGAALAMHGAGLGFGIPDPAGGELRLAADGKIEAVFGYEEFGQGLFATLEQMLIEQFGFAAQDLRIIIGDTDVAPDSGSSTASRATSMMWMALRHLKPDFSRKLIKLAAGLTGLPEAQLDLGPGGIWKEHATLAISYALLAAGCEAPLMTRTEFNYPVTPDQRVGAHFLYTYTAVVVKVEVNTLTGRVRVLDQHHAVAAGPVANPQGYLGQIEGGSSMALGFALTEDAVMQGGCYEVVNLDGYLVPTVMEHNGRIVVQPIEELPETDQYGPRGVGEIGSVALAPAITSAIYQAVGVRVASLPVQPELLQSKLIQAVKEESRS